MRTAIPKVEATGKGPCSNTVFQKSIPLTGKSPMPGSAWWVIWNGLPKPRTKAAVYAAMAQLEAPKASAPLMHSVSNPPSDAVPVVVSEPPVVVAAPPGSTPVVTTPAVSGLLPLPTVALYPAVKNTDPSVIGPGGVRWSLQQHSDAPWAYAESADGRVRQFKVMSGYIWWQDPSPRNRAEQSAATGGGLKVGVPYVLTAKQRIHAPYGCENETVASERARRLTSAASRSRSSLPSQGGTYRRVPRDRYYMLKRWRAITAFVDDSGGVGSGLAGDETP